MTARLATEAKMGSPKLTTSANREKAVCHGSDAMLAKKLKTGAAPKGEALELMAACMTRNMKGLTSELTGWRGFIAPVRVE